MMQTNIDQFCISGTHSIREALALLDKNQLGIVLIVSDDKHLSGTVTDGDIRRAVLASIDLAQPISVLLGRKAAQYVKPITAREGLAPAVYIEILQKNGILHLPIVDEEDRIKGLLRLADLIPDIPLPIQAVVMAGGQGRRLHPLTADTPKPMLHVGEKPLMETMLHQLRQSGIKHVNISTHFKPEKIQEHFGTGKDFDLELSYLIEERPLGTAGAIGLLNKTTDTILVINGDVFTDLDFRKMLAYHREHKADMTIAVRQYDVQVPYGVVECKDHRVTQLTEKPMFNFFVNAGIYLIEPAFVVSLGKESKRLEMTDLIQDLLARHKTVVSFPVLEEWIDIGRPEDFLQAQKMMEQFQKARP